MINDVQTEGRIKDREIARVLAKIPGYPCAKCEYWKFPNGDIDCANKNCGKWQAWFRDYWPRLTEQIKERNGDKK